MPEVHECAELTRSCFRCLLRGDAETLEQILADDFMLIEPLMGWKVTKPTLLQDLRRGVLSFEKLEATGNVREFDKAAIVMGRIQLKGQLGGSCFSLACRYTHMYVQQDGCWRLVAAQETPIETWGRAAG